MSTVIVNAAHDLTSRRRARPIYEVIDVDSIEDDITERPARRRRVSSNTMSRGSSSNAIILDSDDELLASSSSSSRPSGPHHTGRLAFLDVQVADCLTSSGIQGARLISPPPSLPTTVTPPVPRIPREHRRLNRASSRAQPSMSGVVRPNEQPFAFEVSLQPTQTHRMPPAQTPAPAAARPSHHVPSMGFGGALLSLNRQHAIEQRIERERNRERQIARVHALFRGLSSYLPYWRSTMFNGEDADDMLDAALTDSLADDRWHDEAGLFGDDVDFGSHFRRVQQGYKSIYTHPLPPASGFTSDFALPTPNAPSSEVIILDDEAPSTSAVHATASTKSTNSDVNMMLVCAHCLEPLVLGGGALSGEEKMSRKLWGLRCGHILDGKCIAELMKPMPPLNLEKDGVVFGSGEDFGRKGKGKAKVVENEANDASSFTVTTSNRENQSQDSAAALVLQGGQTNVLSTQPVMESNSIRSRLRPRNPTSYAPSSSMHTMASSPSSSINPTSTFRPRPLPRPAYRDSVVNRSASTDESSSPVRVKGKGKQKATAPRIEEEYEWRCPVARCGHVHLSQKVEGKGWVMDEKRGAIGVFA
ncbi:hypothetical protein EW146_g3678 [Bondarzewia mesenterica]|uniref:Uncharacterized protein n=1 Tax=Bondarzewia mesenterica TaxID=1095465 RepID=A0A4S4LZ30_9AGAM|nr:hypothetical protein EW146_g3678 [Bondarzewia mesenterica]